MQHLTSEMDWLHTWSVHGVIQTPIDLFAPSNHDHIPDPQHKHSNAQMQPSGKSMTGTGKKRPLSFPKLNLMSLEQLEFDATDHLRKFRLQAKSQKEKRARLSVNKNDTHDGNFVRIVWIENQSEQNGDATSMNKHLYVEVRIEEALSAAVIFCYHNENSYSGCAMLDDFEFCLARGLRSSYEAVFGWIASVTGGLLRVSLTPQPFTSDDLSNVLSSWIIMEFQLLSKLAHSKATETTKPMMLTFTTPSAISDAGLDTLSLAVPHQALSNMFTNICITKPANATETYPQLPMVPAIQSFIEDAFAIDVSTFPLVKIVTTYAALGADGRFKPTEQDSTYPRTLNYLRPSVQMAKETFKLPSTPP